ncbi:DUF6290 family protein [Coleofasciculus chthonoplastes]
MATITIRLPDQELNDLKKYCQQNDRTQTDVIREYIH